MKDGKGFHDHFSSFSSKYADFRPRYPAAIFDYFATLASPASTVWDCAAGNGQASVDLAARFAHVVATDASAEQIASAKPDSKIEYRVALAEQSGLADESVGLVTVAQALHWFDVHRFFAEVKRVLRPGGVVAVWAYGVNQVEGEPVNEIVQDYYSNVVGPYWPPERKLVEEGYRSIDFPFAEIVPPSFDMETNWNLGQLLGYFSTWSATNRYKKSNGRDPIGPLEEDLAQVWGDPEKTRQVVWPLSIRVGRRA